MPEQKEDLQIVMKAGDILKKEEFVSAFKEVLNYVIKIQQQQAESISKLQETYNLLLKKFEERHNTTLTDLRKQVDGLFVGERVKKMEDTHTQVMKLIDGKLKIVDEKVVGVKNGKDGKDFPPEFIALTNKELNDLKSINDKSYKELKEELNNILQEAKKTRPNQNLGMKKITYQRYHNLTSQLNGSTKAFTLPRKTLDVIAIFGTQFPLNFDRDKDWTFVGNTLTLTSEVLAPESGQTLWALIETPFYY